MSHLALLAAASLALAPSSTLYSDSRPPPVFQGDAVSTVEFSNADRVRSTCEDLFGKAPSGMRTRACATGHRLIMPNPCTYPDSDSYAHLMCHELGHVNGWPSTHGDPSATVARAQTPPQEQADLRQGRS
jgi:hypothetical protein